MLAHVHLEKGWISLEKELGSAWKRAVISLEKGVISLDGCLELGEGWLCFGVEILSGTASMAMARGRLGVKAAFHIQNGAGFPVPRQL